MLNVIVLTVALIYYHGECHYDERRILFIVILNVIMLSVSLFIMLNVILLSVAFYLLSC
jgi:hypothetical protein